MDVINKNDLPDPVVDSHGVRVYELVGRFARSQSESHSLAYITIPSGITSTPHYHPVAVETFYILRGQARVAIGDESSVLGPGDCFQVVPPLLHEITNLGNDDLDLLAVCVPAWKPDNSVFPDGG